MQQFVPTKLYYKIREVCEIVGVEAHVLRFWETEFSALSPPKSKSGQRTYRPKDIELILRIRQLLYEEGFTIAGARKQLRMGDVAVSSQTPPKTGRPRQTRRVPKPEATSAPKKGRLNKVKSELENILTLLDRG
ncbi:MAG: MerR family transcriptional regulator [Acidobacteriota bacterium]